MLMLAKYYAIAHRENDLDREEKLGKAEKYANEVIDMMKTPPKPNPQITDEQWAEAKKDSTAEAYNAIGLANLTRKKYDVAAAEFKRRWKQIRGPSRRTWCGWRRRCRPAARTTKRSSGATR